MTTVATETTATTSGASDRHEAREVFHVEHRCGRTGHRVELARYTVAGGEDRILYGQRVDGVVRFLPEEPVVLDSASGRSEGSGCCAREAQGDGARPNAGRQDRPDDDRRQAVAGEASTTQRGQTGTRVELARYSVAAGDRVLYGQRVDGVVRLTDVPLDGGGRRYLVERGLEEEGSNANAALHALIADLSAPSQRSRRSADGRTVSATCLASARALSSKIVVKSRVTGPADIQGRCERSLKPGSGHRCGFRF
jgi:hypothetical protein